MDGESIKKIESWFVQLNQKFDGLDVKLENRFQALFVSFRCRGSYLPAYQSAVLERFALVAYCSDRIAP